MFFDLEDLERRIRAAGLTPAKACQQAGLAKSTWHRWKSGFTQPTIRSLEKLEAVVAELEKAA